jgi:hypothetical protein
MESDMEFTPMMYSSEKIINFREWMSKEGLCKKEFDNLVFEGSARGICEFRCDGEVFSTSCGNEKIQKLIEYMMSNFGLHKDPIFILCFEISKTDVFKVSIGFFPSA